MRTLFYSFTTFLVVSLAGCSSLLPHRIPKHAIDEFGSSEAFSHGFPGTPTTVCEAARRALLSQGYIVEEAVETVIKARKNFQPAMDSHIQVRFTVTCAENAKGSRSATVFVNAVRDYFGIKKTSNVASVGIGGLASFSLPLTTNDEAMVKIASETISSTKFYSYFYDTVDRYIEVPDEKKATPTEEPVLAEDEEPPTGNVENAEAFEEARVSDQRVTSPQDGPQQPALQPAPTQSPPSTD